MLGVPLNTVVVVGDSVTLACTINFTDVRNPGTHGPGTIAWYRYDGFMGVPIVIDSSPTAFEDFIRYR